jgi:hypothetical protein
MIVVFISPRQSCVAWADADDGVLAESPEHVCCGLGRDAEERRSVANRRALQLVVSASLTA